MRDVPWPVARAAAGRVGAALGSALPTVDLPVAAAAGHVLAADLRALADLPPHDVAAMDGWAVAGPGPWAVRGRLLAGALSDPLAAGEATAVGTGAWLPAGTTAVLRRERGRLAGLVLSGPVEPGRDVRRRGREARAGEALLPAGAVVTPAVVGLACAAGYDTLTVRVRPEVSVLVVGDELLDAGPPRDGRVRDALGPALPGWVGALGGRPAGVRPVPDDAAALARAVREAGGRIVVTTGGTAAGPVDHLHAVLADAAARLVVDGVAVRPGHPMLLAELPDGRPLAGLPGNPLAAASGLLTLLAPLLAAATGRRASPRRVRLTEPVTGHPHDTRLVPVLGGAPSLHAGPAMLRGLAEADGLAVVPPGGAAAGDPVEVLALPWPGLS